MVANQNWLGLTINFNNVEDKTSETAGNSLLKEGFYRATIKNVNKSELGANHKPALTITVTLDDFDNKEITHNIFLPEQTDSENAIKFKKENLRNFFTRFVYRQLTKAEFDDLSATDIDTELQKIQAQQPNFTGAKVLVHIKQEPFISRNRETRAINLTDAVFDDVMGNSAITKPILKVIQAEQSKGVEFFTFPAIAFSNKIAALGFGFYNDYNEGVALKNSQSYDFIQSLGANVVSGESETATDTVEEISF